MKRDEKMNIMITILIGVIAGLVIIGTLETYFSFPIIITLSISYILIFSLLYGYLFMQNNREKDSRKVEKRLKNNRKHPYYGFILAMSNRNDRQVILTYRKMIKNKKYLRFYPQITILFSLYFDQALGLEDEIKKLKRPAWRAYYKTIILLKQNELNQAEEVLKTIKVSWMKEALLCEWKLKIGDRNQAQKHANLALKHARGIILYQLKKEYENKFS